jgi:hypothetical protein
VKKERKSRCGISGERVKRYLAGKRRYSPTGMGKGGKEREREERRYVEKGKKKASRIPSLASPNMLI